MISMTLALGRKKAVPFTIDLNVKLHTALEQFRIDNQAYDNFADYELRSLNGIPYRSLKNNTPTWSNVFQIISMWLNSSNVGQSDLLYAYQDRFFVTKPLKTLTSLHKLIGEDHIEKTFEVKLDGEPFVIYLFDQPVVDKTAPKTTVTTESEDDRQQLLDDTLKLQTKLKKQLKQADEKTAPLLDASATTLNALSKELLLMDNELKIARDATKSTADMIKEQAYIHANLHEELAEARNLTEDSKNRKLIIKQMLLKQFGDSLLQTGERERTIYGLLQSLFTPNNWFAQVTHYDKNNQMEILEVLSNPTYWKGV